MPGGPCPSPQRQGPGWSLLQNQPQFMGPRSLWGAAGPAPQPSSQVGAQRKDKGPARIWALERGLEAQTLDSCPPSGPPVASRPVAGESRRPAHTLHIQTSIVVRHSTDRANHSRAQFRDNRHIRGCAALPATRLASRVWHLCSLYSFSFNEGRRLPQAVGRAQAGAGGKAG